MLWPTAARLLAVLPRRHLRQKERETVAISMAESSGRRAIPVAISIAESGGGSREGWKNRGVGGVAWQAVVVNEGRIVH